ncbi:immune inhibitor A domain-containing protein, partial [Chloroflexota bacterium]
MNLREIHCICPPSPELEERIVRSKQRILARESLPTEGTTDLLDTRSFTLIASRPKRTRPDTFISPAREAVPTVGTKRALVILIDFSDCTATRSQSDVDDMLFSSGTYPTGSMRDFYKEISYNNLDVIGTVTGANGGWYRVPHPKTYYTDGNYGFGDHPYNAQKLVEDAIDLANP